MTLTLTIPLPCLKLRVLATPLQPRENTASLASQREGFGQMEHTPTVRSHRAWRLKAQGRALGLTGLPDGLC